MWSSSKSVVNNEIIKRPTRKTILVSLDPYNVTEAQFSITNVNFTPDDMIVKTITCLNNGGVTGVYKIISDLTDWQPIGIVSTSSVEINTIDLVYKLDKQINGTYTFKFLDYLNQPATLNMWLTIQLEFIKY